MLILMTIFTKDIYPNLLIFLVVMSIGAAPAESSPLINDFVEPKSYSVAQMYMAFAQYLGTTFATAFTIFL